MAENRRDREQVKAVIKRYFGGEVKNSVIRSILDRCLVRHKFERGTDIVDRLYALF